MVKNMEIDYLANHQESVPQIAGWFYEEWSNLYPNRTRDDFDNLVRARARKDKLPLALVAVESGMVVGTISLKMQDMNDRNAYVPWVAGLYVVKEWRSRGIGTKLVQAVEGKAREMGIRKLFLYTPKSERFYSRLGWCIIGHTGYRGTPVSLMEKEIAIQP